MSLGEEATGGAIVRLTPVDADQVPIPMDSLMSASTGHGAQELRVPPPATGSIREYTQIGDGIQLDQQTPSLLPLLEQARQQSAHRPVHKVSVVGCHVLRYVSRTYTTSPARYEYCHNLRMRSPRLDAFNVLLRDRADTSDWVEQHANVSSNLRLRPSTESLRFHFSSWNGILLRILNWKICFGVLCILAVQAVLRLAYQQLYNSRYL